MPFDFIPSITPRIPRPFFSFSDDHFDGIRRRAINSTNFRHLFNSIKNIHRESALHHDDEAMPAGQIQRVSCRDFDELHVVAAVPV